VKTAHYSTIDKGRRECREGKYVLDTFLATFWAIGGKIEQTYPNVARTLQIS
jgi:hypothetical protein